MDVNYHLTASGNSCDSKGYFWGYRYQAEIRNSINSRCFLPDLGSVPATKTVLFLPAFRVHRKLQIGVI